MSESSNRAASLQKILNLLLSPPRKTCGSILSKSSLQISSSSGQGWFLYPDISCVPSTHFEHPSNTLVSHRCPFGYLFVCSHLCPTIMTQALICSNSALPCKGHTERRSRSVGRRHQSMDAGRAQPRTLCKRRCWNEEANISDHIEETSKSKIPKNHTQTTTTNHEPNPKHFRLLPKQSKPVNSDVPSAIQKSHPTPSQAHYNLQKTQAYKDTYLSHNP
jgi:hypothetical protein